MDETDKKKIHEKRKRMILAGVGGFGITALALMGLFGARYLLTSSPGPDVDITPTASTPIVEEFTPTATPTFRLSFMPPIPSVTPTPTPTEFVVSQTQPTQTPTVERREVNTTLMGRDNKPYKVSSQKFKGACLSLQVGRQLNPPFEGSVYVSQGAKPTHSGWECKQEDDKEEGAWYDSQTGKRVGKLE